MSSSGTLPDLLNRTDETIGDEVFYRFSEDFTIKTEIFFKSDPQRILPLGSPQQALMNHLLHFPERVRDKRVFEPFAGSGALGFMSLKLGARHVDFVDINPRAAEFQRDNAALNHFPIDGFSAITNDIADVVLEEKSDVLLANPPFVPTPPGLTGTLTSNGGPEGNNFVDIVLERLPDFLKPEGTALLYVLQFCQGSEPLVIGGLNRLVKNRPIDLTPTQKNPISFESYCEAYMKLFSQSMEETQAWRSELTQRLGQNLTLCHYVVDIGPESGDATECVIRDDFAEKFGESFLVPSENEAELAFSRAFENFIPPPQDADLDEKV
ncbi:methyltransferase [Myxococcota bacterium]|nr:methyltransferase [Myxococcota bacterium]